MSEMVVCPNCNGSGTIQGVFVEYAEGFDGPPVVDMHCDLCQGRKEITDDQIRWREHGAAIKKGRLAAKLTLREASSLMGVRPSYLSGIEQGKVFNLNFQPELWKSLASTDQPSPSPSEDVR